MRTMSRRRKRDPNPSKLEILIFDPHTISLQAANEVLATEDIGKLERYARLYDLSNDHGNRETVLRDELGVDLTRLVVL